MASVDPARLLELVDALRLRRVAVVGDLIADEFIYGEIARVSREAPVLILNYDSTELVPGGAGNAAGNVAALGGDRARRSASPGATNRAGVCSRRCGAARSTSGTCFVLPAIARRPRRASSPAASIPPSSRWFASTAPRPPRLDDGVRAAFAARVLAAVDGCDALLVSDYGSGLVTPRLVSEAHAAHPTRRRDRARQARQATDRTALPSLVDSRYGCSVPRHDRLHAE